MNFLPWALLTKELNIWHRTTESSGYLAGFFLVGCDAAFCCRAVKCNFKKNLFLSNHCCEE